MKLKLIMYLAFGLSMIALEANAAPDPPKDGKLIFNSRCAACHNVNQELTGPALAGVHDRRTMDWIVNFVRSSKTMVEKGDKDAVAIYEKFNKIPMPDHPDLTEENIKSIVEFIKSEAKPAGEEKAPFAKPADKKENYSPISFKNNFWPLMGVMVSVLLLVATLLFAAKVNTMKKELASRKLSTNS